MLLRYLWSKFYRDNFVVRHFKYVQVDTKSLNSTIRSIIILEQFDHCGGFHSVS